jgi:sirohydrochlorin cobaltochelatase
VKDDFSDAALVLAGHGSTLNADSAAPVYQHAAELRRRGLFAQTLEAFWKQEPSLMQVARSVSAPRVFVVPLFISEGYFSGEVIPRELGFRREGEADFARVQRRAGQTWYYCAPVGTHPGMSGVLLARAQNIVEKFPFPRAPKPAETTLIIAGHGTGRNENSREAIVQQVEIIRAQGLFAGVQGVYLEEEPRIGECYKLAQTKDMIVVPFFISDGMHSNEDIPVMLGASRTVVQERLKVGQPAWRNPTEHEGRRLWYTASVGTEPLVAEIILERVRACSRREGA